MNEHMQEVLEGLLVEYKKGPHTKSRRDEFMSVVEKVLDYFIPIYR